MRKNPRGRLWVVARTATGRRTRRDALPEEIVYVDRGCVLAPRCLECPRERCVYDGGCEEVSSGGVQRAKWVVRLAGVVAAVKVRRGEGASIEELEGEFGMGRRTVFRMLRRARATS